MNCRNTAYYPDSMRDILPPTDGQPLPDASKLPYQFVSIVHWGKPDHDGGRSGVRRRCTDQGWRNDRDYDDIVTTLGEGESWDWDGFCIDGFNGSYLFLKELDTPSDVLASIRVLSRWLATQC